jgi:hypothetical protein
MADAKVKIKMKMKNSQLKSILSDIVGKKDDGKTFDGAGGPKEGYGPTASKLMGGPSDYKPPTASDKKMSERHISHRVTVDKMKDPVEAVKASIKYNHEHAKEHLKALKKAKKEKEKLAKE